jgi:hypothetical protein
MDARSHWAGGETTTSMTPTRRAVPHDARTALVACSLMSRGRVLRP